METLILMGLGLYLTTTVVLGGKRGARVPKNHAPSAAAPSIPGHVMPTPTNVMDGPEGLWSYFASKGIPRPSIADITPWPDATGIWRLPSGALYQFTDCDGRPMGRPGYMPLRYKAFLDANVNCDGTPIMKPKEGGGSPIDPNVQTGIQVGMQVATAAAAAAGGGEAVAAGVGAAAAAAAACI